MASAVLMPAPVCLIENDKGELRVNQKSLQILSSITEPVVVVAIVGLCRTRKSYLMNKLAGKKSGFSLGSSLQSHTKGIWMWCVPHPKKPNHTLVLLDTEGLGDVEKSHNKNDMRIFTLAVLLSSTLVYNNMGTINQQAMDQLHYVTELSEYIKSRSAPNTDSVENSSDFVTFFPDLARTVLDFTLKLKINGKPTTSNEYLEIALKLKKGKPEEVRMFNLPRQCICQFFPKKKCFIFDRPTHRKKLSQLENLHDSELEPEFVEQVESFCSYIFQHSNVKTLHGGITVNGPRLQNLILTYVEAITSGEMPCMENAVLALAEIENSAAVQRALKHYEEIMKKRLQFPIETLQEFLDIHATCKSEATAVFTRNSFKYVDQKFQKELESQLEVKHDAFFHQNQDELRKQYRALLQDNSSPLEEAVKNGDFPKQGSYGLFLQKTKELKQKCYQQPRKETQAEKSLQEYLKPKEDIPVAKLQAAQSLSPKERDIEVECVKTQAAEAAIKHLEEVQKKTLEIIEQNDRRYWEHINQLTQKMETERKHLIEEQKYNLALNLQVSLEQKSTPCHCSVASAAPVLLVGSSSLQLQEQLPRSGFQDESEKLKNEIRALEKSLSESREKIENCIIC